MSLNNLKNQGVLQIDNRLKGNFETHSTKYKGNEDLIQALRIPTTVGIKSFTNVTYGCESVESNKDGVPLFQVI